MLTRIAGGRVIDPAAARDGVGDIWIEDERIVAPPGEGRAADRTIDASGCIVMAGAIEVHSHIAGGNVVLSRLLMPELSVDETPRGAVHNPYGSGTAIGAAYARMGYTTAIEPALVPNNALGTHLELSDIPLLDRGGLAVLGNDDQLLSLLRGGASAEEVRDLVAVTLATARGLGVKVINAGGAVAFKEGAVRFGLDDEVPAYGLTSRQVLQALLRAVDSLGVPHPLHVHCSNLGLPGADETFARTVQAAEGHRIHLAHAQFYAYAEAEPGVVSSGFRSAAERICQTIADNPNATLDVGQVVFGQTRTLSLDTIRQYAGRKAASPKKWVLMAGDAEGVGIVPFAYRRAGPTSALQFAIGLEIMLLSPDPGRVLLTTDHPNGGPFTAYPRILHLLMDREERERELARLPEVVKERSSIARLDREYTLAEVAMMTRVGPAQLLGLRDRGHLQPGARADIAIYRDDTDRTAMFSAAAHVLKDGRSIVEAGEVVDWSFGRTLLVAVEPDSTMARRADSYLDQRFGIGLSGFAVPNGAFPGRQNFSEVPCRS